MTTRRAFLSSLAALVAAPAVIRTPGLLMPVRSIAVPSVRLYVLPYDDFVDIGVDGSVNGGLLPPVSPAALDFIASINPFFAAARRGLA